MYFMLICFRFDWSNLLVLIWYDFLSFQHSILVVFSCSSLLIISTTGKLIKKSLTLRAKTNILIHRHHSGSFGRLGYYCLLFGRHHFSRFSI